MTFKRDVLDHMPDSDNLTSCAGFVIYDFRINRYLHSKRHYYGEYPPNEPFGWSEHPQGVVFTSVGTDIIPVEDRMLDFARFGEIRSNIDLRECVLLPAMMYVHEISINHVEVFVEVDFVNGFNFLDAMKNSDKI